MIASCPHCDTDLEFDDETHAALAEAGGFACPVCAGLVEMPPQVLAAEPEIPVAAADEAVVACPHCALRFGLNRGTLAVLRRRRNFPCPGCAELLPVALLPRPAGGGGAMVAPPPPVVRRAPVLPGGNRPAGLPGPGKSAPLPSPKAPPLRAQMPAAVPAKAGRGLNRSFLILGATALLALGGLGLFLASRPPTKTTVIQTARVNEVVRNKFFQDLIAAGATTARDLEEISLVRADGDGYLGLSRDKLTWAGAQRLAQRTGARILALEDTLERDAGEFGQWLAGQFPGLPGSTVWVGRHGREAMSDLPDVLPVTSLGRPRQALFEWRPRVQAEFPRWQAPDGAAFVVLPGGTFQMGDSLDGDGNAPVVRASVSPFRLQVTETTKAQWDAVRAWGLANGYPDLPEGEGKGPDHPVQKVNWHDAVKWCNARSELHGLRPAYQAAGGIYRSGQAEQVACGWEAGGYRLPTEAEWEYAARGGRHGQRYPWGFTISHEQANFRNAGRELYRGGASGYHPRFSGGGPPFTAPVASFPPNGFGLHDITGNVWEWCWDWYGRGFYRDGATDPRGPESGDFRVLRGGSWYSHAYYTRTAIRIWLKPESPLGNRGFRPARSGTGADDPPVAARPLPPAPPAPEFDIRLTGVEPPATLAADGAIRVPAQAGERFRIELTVRHRTPVETKLAANLLLREAGFLAPEVIAELEQNHNTTWHFDTESRPGYSSVQGEGTLSFDLTGYAPPQPGEHSFNLNFGLFDKATWATHILKVQPVALIVAE
jgi:formylglycine-generating enzyme required for sulfatase activity